MLDRHPAGYDLETVLWELDLDEQIRFSTPHSSGNAELKLGNVVCLFPDEEWPEENDSAETNEPNETDKIPTELEEITHVGSSRAEALREAGFDTVGAVRDAKRAELTAVERISAGVAARIKTGLEDGKSENKDENKDDDKNRAESQAENQNHEGGENTGSQPEWKPSPGTIQEAGEDEHVFTLEVRETRLVQVTHDRFSGYEKVPRTRTVVEYEEGPIRCSCGEAFSETEAVRKHVAEVSSRDDNQTISYPPLPITNSLYPYGGEGANVLPDADSEGKENKNEDEDEDDTVSTPGR
jgi:hypothetical protein